MKKLVLGALVAGVVSQAAGCIIVSDDEDSFDVTASWDVQVGGSPAACPAGVDTARIVLRPVDGGTDLVDLFDCAAGIGTSSGIPAGQYQLWIELTNHDGTQINSQSLSEFIDVEGDVTVSQPFDIHLDQGYFSVGWTLSNGGAAASCADIGAAGVSITSTLNSDNSLFDTEFACENGFGVSDPLPAGSYTVSIAATNSAGQALGTAPTLTNKVIQDHNRVTDLGTVDIAFGQFPAVR